MNPQELLWNWMLQAEWQASLLIGLIFLAGRLLGGRLSPRWRFALWLVVAVRLLLPPLPFNPVGMYHYVPATPVQAWERIAPDAAVPLLLRPETEVRRFQPTPSAGPLVPGVAAVPSRSPRSWRIAWPSFSQVAFWIWIAGASVGLLRLAWGHFRFNRELRCNSRPAGPELEGLLAECKAVFGIRKNVALVITEAVSAPAMLGFWSPRLLLPEAVAAARPAENGQRLRLIFLHELAHLRRRDPWTHLLALLAERIHWFNPLVWLALRRMRVDREMAVDALVLSSQNEETREAYGETLLALLESAVRPTSRGPALGILENKADLKKRLRAIARFRTGAYAWSSLGTALLLLMVAVGFGEKLKEKLAPLPTSPEARLSIRRRFFDAIQKGDLSTVESLVERGLDSSLTGPANFGLKSAISRQRVEILRFLISKGARVNEKAGSQVVPLEQALALGNREMIDLLIAAGAQCDPALLAASTGTVASLTALEAKTPFSKSNLLKMLRYSAVAGKADNFEWLLAKTPFENDKERLELLRKTYLDVAAFGPAPMLSLLEKQGVDPLEAGNEALASAAFGIGGSSRADVVRHLLGKEIPLKAKNEALANAVAIGNLETAKLLLDHGAEIQHRDSIGTPMIHSAISWDHPKMAEFLLERGADPNLEDGEGHNAAWVATYAARMPEILPKLIEHGANVKNRDKTGRTILHEMVYFVPPSNDEEEPMGLYFSPKESKAFLERERRIVEQLARAGVDLNAVYNSDGPGSGTPLMAAIGMGHYAAAEALIKAGATISGTDSHGNTALALCVGGAWRQPLPVGLIGLLLERGVDPKEGWVFPGGFEKEQPSRPVLEAALEQGVIGRPAMEGRENARKTVELLLRHGAKFAAPVDEKSLPLLEAAAKGDLRGVREAVKQGAKIDVADGDGWNALTVALALGYEECADWLIANGASGLGVTKEGHSSLEFAVYQGNEKQVRHFLEQGADPNAGGPLHAPLLAAILRKNRPLFEILSKHGTKGNPWMLFLCIQRGQLEMARSLLESGVPPEPEKPNENRGNVYWAVNYNQPEILEMLLDHGADPALKDDYGATPLSRARQSDGADKKLVTILEATLEKRKASAKSPEP